MSIEDANIQIKTDLSALLEGLVLTGFMDIVIFTTNGQVSPISTSDLICYCV